LIRPAQPRRVCRGPLPGAHNVPLFDDIDRALIGTLYARRSRDEAFEEGRVRTQAAIDGIVRRIGELTAGKRQPWISRSASSS
jgi:tRNA 2-selenouridine synthase